MYKWFLFIIASIYGTPLAGITILLIWYMWEAGDQRTEMHRMRREMRQQRRR